MKLVNASKNLLLLSECWVMDNPLTRLAGLMGRRLEAGQGALLLPCSSVHTFFMREPIDFLFLDREGRVLASIEAFRTWGIPPFVRDTSMIAEGKAGSLAPFSELGDKIIVEP